MLTAGNFLLGSQDIGGLNCRSRGRYLTCYEQRKSNGTILRPVQRMAPGREGPAEPCGGGGGGD